MKMLNPILVGLAWLTSTAICAVSYDEYILAPDSRIVYPRSVYNINGTVDGAESLFNPTGSATFSGASAVTFDFSKNIAGFVSLSVGNSSSTSARIGLAYSESSQWISGLSSDAQRDNVDELIYLPVGQGAGNYSVDKDHDRGGFRYLSLILETNDTVEITSVNVNYTAAPNQDLRNYMGFFHSNDELLNRIWYAGAYTTQLCTIDPKRGNAILGLPTGTARPGQLSLDPWYNNYTLTDGDSCLIDGAKRDRLVWPGDMAISIPSVFVSTNDMSTIRNSIDSLLALQTSDGMLPYAGVPLPSTASWTYHLHNLLGVDLYYTYTGDKDFLTSVFDKFKAAIAWSLSSVDESHLMNVTSSADWLRSGMGGHNIEANAILYYALNRGLDLASVVGDTSVVTEWTDAAAAVKNATYSLLWDDAAGLYRDNEDTDLMPQDGNAWAIKAGITQSATQSQTISDKLHSRWNAYGAPAPEAPGFISPFIGGFELEAHFLAENPQTAIDLMRLQWGYMLNDPRMTNSSFIEGYGTDGNTRYVYANDQRLSHAHAWSSGPTAIMSFYVAGIQLRKASGAVWHIAPRLGDLTEVHGGYLTPMGRLDVQAKATDGKLTELTFTAPGGTYGSVSLPGVQGTLTSNAGNTMQLNENGEVDGVGGDTWTLSITG